MLHLYTEDGLNLPKNPWNIYPRPQLKRDSFFSLNGTWEFGTDKSCSEKILVPFCPESLLSGITRTVDSEYLFYKKEFSLPENFIKDRVFLHFGAVDQFCTVYLNNVKLGTNAGGYNHFSFEITDFLKETNRLTVIVKDELNLTLPYGKQSKKRGGMWYTAVSGIWQTVWIESTPENFIEDIIIEADDEQAKITVKGVLEGNVIFEDVAIPLNNGVAVYKPENVKKWSPETPHLYYFTVESQNDRIESYLAFRKLETKEVNGIMRLCLNGEPYFFSGVLDQGYFSDGIFTPATENGYEKDILLMKEAGFNTLRKHIKIEPDQFYYDCDRLGMVVFQDMVNNGGYSFFRDTLLATLGLQKLNDKKLHKDKKTRRQFINKMHETIKQLRNHPSICLWTIFNEGWGQFDANEAYKKLKSIDSSRFIDTTSGWFRNKESDVESLHIYFKKLKLQKSKKPIIISEFGGYALSIKDHVFNPDNQYGYKKFTYVEALDDAVCTLFEDQVLPLVKKGLCASIYTQLSDVEDETNGLVTYDRKIKKFSERLSEVNKKIYEEIK